MADTEKKTEKKEKQSRTMKPIYAVVQILNAAGEPQAVPKEQIKVVKGFKSAEAVLDALDSGELKNATYVKVSLD